MSSSRKSNYVLIVDNISSMTLSRDIEKEFSRYGKIRDVERIAKHRCALVEFYRSSDAKYAWRKMDRFRMDGRDWKVDYANKGDFKFFGWKWFEDVSPSRSRSRSRSPRSPSKGRSPSPSKARSPSPSKGRSPSRSASPPRKERSRSPDTPRNKDGKRSASRSPGSDGRDGKDGKDSKDRS